LHCADGLHAARASFVHNHIIAKKNTIGKRKAEEIAISSKFFRNSLAILPRVML